MKQQRSWLKIVLVLVLLLLAFLGGLFTQRALGTAFVVQQQTSDNAQNPQLYSWTFALCTLEGRCMDVHVECNGKQVLNVRSVTEIGGHDADWQDPRGGNPKVCPWNSLSNNKS